MKKNASINKNINVWCLTNLFPRGEKKSCAVLFTHSQIRYWFECKADISEKAWGTDLH